MNFLWKFKEVLPVKLTVFRDIKEDITTKEIIYCGDNDGISTVTRGLLSQYGEKIWTYSPATDDVYIENIYKDSSLGFIIGLGTDSYTTESKVYKLSTTTGQVISGTVSTGDTIPISYVQIIKIATNDYLLAGYEGSDIMWFTHIDQNIAFSNTKKYNLCWPSTPNFIQYFEILPKMLLKTDGRTVVMFGYYLVYLSIGQAAIKATYFGNVVRDFTINYGMGDEDIIFVTSTGDLNALSESSGTFTVKTPRDFFPHPLTGGEVSRIILTGTTIYALVLSGSYTALAKFMVATPSVAACTTNLFNLNNLGCIPRISTGCHPKCQSSCLDSTDQTCAGTCSGSAVMSTCFCAVGTAWGPSNACQSLLTSNCDGRCFNCFTIQSNSACASCNGGHYAEKGSGSDYLCNCQSGRTYDTGGSGYCYLTSASCDGRCNGKCIRLTDNTACMDCASGTTKTGSQAPYTCSCPSGSTYDATASMCLFSTGCSTMCLNKCSQQSSNTACYADCAASYEKSGTGPIYTCNCASGSTYDPGIGGCLATTNCSPKCATSQCSVQNSDLACYGGCKYPDMTQTLMSTNIYSCSCPADKPWDSSAIRCLYAHADCDLRCNDKCVDKNLYTSCYSDCATGMTKTPNTPPIYTCDCPSGSAFDPTLKICLYSSGCSAKCATSCSVQSSDSSCYNGCKYADYVSTLISTSIYQCDCPADKPYDSSAQRCLYSNTDCDPRCNSKCVEKNSYINCYSSCASGMTQTGTGPIYTCDCSAGTSWASDIKICLYSTSCSTKCASTCSNQNSDSACYSGCKYADYISTVVSTSIYSCACPSDKPYDATADRCLYTSTDCDPRCNSKCVEKNSNINCYSSCASGMSQTGTGLIITCDCPVGTSWETSIKACLYSSSCSAKCASTCTAINSDSSCFNDCKYPDYIKTLMSTSIYKCECPVDKPYDATALRCLYTTDCDKRCQGGCKEKNSNIDCYGGCSYPDMTSTLIGDGIYSCTCPSDKPFDATAGRCLYTTSCDSNF